MNALLIGNYALDQQESMQRYARMLQGALKGCGVNAGLIQPAPHFAWLHPDGSLGKWLGYVDKFVSFPRAMRQVLDWADVVHVCDHSNAMYVKKLTRKPHVITCHDLLAVRSALGEVEHNRTRFAGRRLQGMILSGLRRAQHVVCVSENTRNELLRVAGLEADRVSVVYSGLNYQFSPAPPGEAELCLSALGITLRRPYILHVGGNQWYKNRFGVLQIYNSLRKIMRESTPDLIMAGKPFTPPMREFIRDRGLARQVMERTRVSNQSLCSLYSRAHALLFPSLAEGFGWPVIEAQACGCPVICADRTPMTEIAGRAAVFIPPDQPETAARLIAEKWSSLPALRKPGFRNVARFNIDNMARSYARIYRDAILNTVRRQMLHTA